MIVYLYVVVIAIIALIPPIGFLIGLIASWRADKEDDKARISRAHVLGRSIILPEVKIKIPMPKGARAPRER